jgi:dynein intermediate chain 1
VWQVAWADDGAGAGADGAGRGPLTFYSVAADGRVAVWTMTKSELTAAVAVELKPTPADGMPPPLPAAGSDGGAAAAAADSSVIGSLVGGCCFDFAAASDGVFVVGTEEGGIHRCSTAFSSRYLASYEGHSMAVYALRWNPHHGGVFLSASADWRVKLWDAGAREPVLAFDLGAAVGDAAWAPHSSTAFAAVTADGRCHVFDLTSNKHEPLCAQKVVKKARLTKVAFNPVHPVLLCGDDRGGVTCLKLSPNLRKPTPLKDEDTTPAQVELAKINRLFEIARRGDGGSGQTLQLPAKLAEAPAGATA